jgi:hypothetical protein
VTAYRKKPVVIEAWQCRPGSTTFIISWVLDGGGTARYHGEDDTIKIASLEGTMSAELYDWVIRGVKGEFYPCKPDIFDATYEVA